LKKKPVWKSGSDSDEDVSGKENKLKVKADGMDKGRDMAVLDPVELHVPDGFGATQRPEKTANQ
jgi:hypothetical protein